MNRALRRHQQRVARVRLVRTLWEFWGSDSHAMRKPWRAINRMGRYLMNDPAWHHHLHVIEPARIRSNALLHELQQGADPQMILWPDYRRAHIW